MTSNNYFKNAFTLIELLVVIAIIGILSGLIVVGMSFSVNSARIAKAQIFSASLRDSLLINMIAEYKLDGNANDTWGGHNGAITGATTASDCVYGTCLSFNGSSQYVSVADDTVFNFGNQMTAMVWVKGGPQQSRGVLGQYDNGINQRSWVIMATDSTSPYERMRVYLSSDGTSNTGFLSTLESTIPTFDNKWHLIGFTYDAGSLKLYIDGNLNASSSSVVSSLYDSSSNLTIGSRLANALPAFYFSGSIDEARIYNSVIPVSQIKQQYYSGMNILLSRSEIMQYEYINKIKEL